MISASPSYDVVIVGAGFSGIYLLHRLRSLGYACRIFEAGDDLGGVWHWNTYPGVRVDAEAAIYQLSFPEAWKDWSFSEKYPSGKELQDYFAHLDKTLDIKKDVNFNTTVTGAQFDKHGAKRWAVETGDGRITTSRFLLLGVGFAAKRYTPDIPGLDTFIGEVYHSSFWPKGNVDVQDKKVAVIGTGASGVQIVQEWGKEAESLSVFQRTPNLALPMQQRAFSSQDQQELKVRQESIFQDRELDFGGYLCPPTPAKTFDVSAEEREAHWESLFQKGGFSFLLSGYSDVLVDEHANREAYNFWAKKTRARIVDPRKKDILAPLEQLHPIGAKRSSYEQDYFEQFNRSNVDVVNLREPGHAIAAIRPEGIELENGTVHSVDIIAFATGFDGVTGSMTSIPNLRNTSGVTLAEEWKDGARTYLGMTRKGYPNMFFTYGAQAPGALSNGPTSIEMQGRWILDAIQKIDESGLTYIEPTDEAESGWKALINQITDMTLFPKADSWYMGANIPGKKREMLNFPGGLPLYEQLCRKTLDNWDGFVTV
ncbi:hypothetical protein BJY04DRAFT_170473 [Aspergillus karnatakaensis]|uniref:flavin-containing monooxygenase n=1 Tax=Aspergillus karnatakaensis TaxID=1810916 RepID=UPI003CCD5547